MLSPAKCVALAGIGVTGFFVGQDPGTTPSPTPGPPPLYLAIARLTPDATIAIGGERRISAAADAVWVTNREAGTLTKIDPKSNAAGAPIAVGKEPCFTVLTAFKSVWVPLCGTPGLARVATAAEPAPAAPDTPAATVITKTIRAAGPITAGAGSIWMITDPRGALSRIDPDTNAVVAEVAVAAGSAALAFSDEAVWVASARGNTVTRVNGRTNVVTDIVKVGRGPSAIAAGAGAVWTLNSGDGTVSRIDMKTNTVTATIKTGVTGPNGSIVIGEGSVWISAAGWPLTRLDPATNQVRQQFTGPGGGALAMGAASIWLAAEPQAIWRVDPRRVEATRK